MRPRWQLRPGSLGGPAPVWPRVLDRAADRWAAAGARARMATLTVLVLGGAVAVRPAGEPLAPAIVARGDLPAGATLHAGVLQLAERPAATLPPDAVRTAGEVDGATLRHPVAEGQPVLRRAVVAGVDAMLAPGRVAVPLPLELVPTLEAGQRLDVVGTDATGAPGVLARDAVVLRVDGDGAWIEVDREASAALGHAIAFGALTVAVLPAGR